MPLDFELTISGLCLITIKADPGDERPAQPKQVDVLCIGSPGSHGEHDHGANHDHGVPDHKPRLSYRPERVVASVEPDLFVDPQGGRIASLDLSGKVLSLDLGANAPGEFSLDWGPSSATEPEQEEQERWMNWVPSVQHLGLPAIGLDGVNGLPPGAGARLTLPPGNLSARQVIRVPGSSRYVHWNYPAVNVTSALANELVYTASGVQHVRFQWDGQSIFKSSSRGIFRVSISNDLAAVPLNYNSDVRDLGHLAHVAGLIRSRARIGIPRIVDDVPPQRTGRPICNQLISVYS